MKLFDKKDMTFAQSASRRAAYGGLFIALAFLLSYLEYLIPMPVIAPGVKPGLANIVTVFALYKLKTTDTVVISGARVVLTSFAFGGGFSLLYSASGALLSLTVMLLLKKSGKFSPVGVSAAGGVAHNIGQIAVAMIAMGTSLVLWYIPVLIISGTLTGALVGVGAGIIIKNLR